MAQVKAWFKSGDRHACRLKLAGSLLLCFLFFGACLPGEEKRENLVNVRSFAVESTGSELPEFYLKTESGYELLTISSRQPGNRVEGVSGDPLQLYRKSEGPGGEDLFEPIDAVPLKDHGKSVLLLVWHTEKGIRYQPVRDYADSGDSRDWLIINTTSKSIAFQVGTETDPLSLDPGSHRLCDFDRLKRSAAVRAHTKEEEENKAFYSTYWPIPEKERLIVIFVEANDRIQVHRIFDSP